jgi:hypothetical protein
MLRWTVIFLVVAIIAAVLVALQPVLLVSLKFYFLFS